jgi:hypothetical protein
MLGVFLQQRVQRSTGLVHYTKYVISSPASNVGSNEFIAVDANSYDNQTV